MTQAADNRRKDVLRAVILEYLRCGEPVGSSNLCDRYDLGVSPATVRNDLADLVDAGLLIQPHTSAGRLPSERGYRTYVDEFLGDAEVSNNQRERIVLAMKAFEYRRERAAQEFARMVAEISGEAVVMRYGSEGATLLTGLKNLASKPEAKTGRVMIDFSAALDDIDGTLEKISAQLTEDVTILVGEGNPFGENLSAVFADIEVAGIGRALIGIVGPQRMDYDRAVALMRILRQQGVRLIE